MTYCCEVFPKIAKTFRWSRDGKNYNPTGVVDSYSLPYIKPKRKQGEFVNFCPSCGADIRGIVIMKDEFDKLK